MRPPNAWLSSTATVAAPTGWPAPPRRVRFSPDEKGGSGCSRSGPAQPPNPAGQPPRCRLAISSKNVPGTSQTLPGAFSYPAGGEESDSRLSHPTGVPGAFQLAGAGRKLLERPPKGHDGGRDRQA